MIKPIHNSILTTKPRLMPKGLIYNHKNSDLYHLFETKTGQVVGKMVAFNIKNENPHLYNVSSKKDVLYISSLEIEFNRRREGWGTYFMDFAKKESYKRGCEGRVYLVALDYERPPQVFYRKQGFLAIDEETNKKLDGCVLEDKPFYTLEAVDMYLPLGKDARPVIKKKDSTTKKSFWDYIKDCFKC